MKKYITRTVLLLSLVSFFGDISSEMLYPIMPAFLAQIGFGAFGIGALEAVARLVSGLGKFWFGALSDQLDRRLIFIRAGYFLSALAKPLMGLFPYPAAVFGARNLDRVGKGLRGSARDAVLVEESGPENRGKVFGFHRGMDTLGAAVGPVLALVYLHFYPDDYITIFLLAFFPGMCGVLITFFLPPEHDRRPRPVKVRPFKGIFEFWKTSSPAYRRILAGGLLFALINSTDMLLLLRAGELGLSAGEVVGAYVLYNLVYALLSLPFGRWGDRFGFRRVYLWSVAVFAVCYLGMGLVTEKWMVWGIFVLYGAFTSANEGATKSWLSLHIAREHRATGLGLFSLLDSVFLAAASLLAGLVWELSSGKAVFVGVGSAGLLIFVLLLFILPLQPKTT